MLDLRQLDVAKLLGRCHGCLGSCHHATVHDASGDMMKAVENINFFPSLIDALTAQKTCDNEDIKDSFSFKLGSQCQFVEQFQERALQLHLQSPFDHG